MKVTILTNGPGELWGWVRPVVSELRKRGHTISLWLLPCQFSSGHEREAASFLGVDKLEGPSGAARTWQEIEHENTDKIIQLGGDIMFGLKMSKSAKVALTVYSYRAVKKIHGVKILVAYPSQVNGVEDVEAIGDLVKDSLSMDITPTGDLQWDWPKAENSPRVLFLPGSRPAIRSAALEWLCEVNTALRKKIPDVRVRTLFSQFMPESEIQKWREAGLEPVRAGAGIAMRNADYALTQPGTNNFELMHCGLPGLVAAPEKFLKFVPISGALGILANLPLIGLKLRKIGAMRIIDRWNGFISLPNRTANKKILSELYGNITPKDAAEAIFNDLSSPEKLSNIHDELLNMSGENGAASRLCDIALNWGVGTKL
ncbi:MAG: hypothetical protein SPL10_04400 [Synergistales bacterium]|nr:hypothetical protein [Synergistales bacterium]MDY6401250.1 hypothetical protein [Synergistales bacterium]MDY6404410.1 hypothetical protein [Synergistales bacterium]MDY6410231.1 hypothetical protein [Synergistales bacterium]MDY6414384.1 hypothetical protein [Synergistales bacterium]